ncbi:transmembrane protein 216-like [Musca vetustissima]|uniref:transmembrane protein 216-like n=1 Tax=Musca vetustissima TaxID=27455 RepID=UPI002AB61577|nr:transmembrane protein 216-like [Musca vetustissima]XP_061400030.1 transmembrane protein 216-like [Musca vetustissima]
MEASLMYEILMYLNSFYFGLYAAFKVCVSTLKFILLTYPENAVMREGILLLSMCVLETVRIILGRRSSLSARAWQAIASVVLTLPSLVLVIYLCFFQTAVLKLEVIMSALMIALHVAEIVYASMFICTMCRPVTYT